MANILISQTEQVKKKRHEQNIAKLQFCQVMSLGFAVAVIQLIQRAFHARY